MINNRTDESCIYRRTNGIPPVSESDRNYIRHGEFFIQMMQICKTKVTENTLVDNYRFVSTILDSMNRDNYRIEFKHLMNALSFIRPHIYSEQKETGGFDLAKPQVREELKYEIVKTIRLLFTNLDNENFLRIHNEFHGRFIVLFHAIVRFLITEKLRKLKEECLLCIAEMIRSPSMSIRASSKLTTNPQIVSSYNIITPMLVSHLQNSFVIDCERNGRTIQQKSIQLYGDIVRVMFNDSINDKKCTDWIRKSIEHLHFDRLEVFLAKSVERVVKIQLIETCSFLLDECAITLEKQVPDLIELLLILSEDEDQQVTVAEKANFIIEKYSHKIHWRTNHLLWTKFEELIVHLPDRLKDAASDSEQMLYIVKLLGYCKVLKDSLHRGQVVSEKLTTALLKSCKMVTGNFLIDEMSTISEDLKQKLTYDQLLTKRFEYIQNERNLRQFMRIVSTCYSPNRAMFESFFNTMFYKIIEDSTGQDFEKSQRNEAFFLISCLFVNLNKSDFEANSETILRNVREYFERIFTDDLRWYLPIEGSKCSNNVRLLRYNMLTYSLRLESIAIITRQLKFKVQRFLQPYYFMVFEQAGSNLAQISRSGIFALNEIATGFGYDDVRALLNDNANFVLSMLKKRLDWDPELTFVLNGIYVLTKFNVLKMSNYLFYLMHDILMHSFDRYGFERHSLAYLKIFNILLESLTNETLTKLIVDDVKLMNDLKSGLFDRKAADDETGNKSLPVHIRIIEKIIERSINFLPSKTKRNCCIYALTVVRKCFELIAEYSDVLLPLVHRTWSPLVPRFTNFNDHLVLLYSFRLLLTMADVSRDFIRLRTSQTVWSKLCDLIKCLAKEPSQSISEPKYKLQVELIDGLPKLIHALDVTDSDLVMAMDALKYFLNSNVPKVLQDKTRGSFNELMQFNKKIVQEHLLKIPDFVIDCK